MKKVLLFSILIFSLLLTACSSTTSSEPPNLNGIWVSSENSDDGTAWIEAQIQNNIINIWFVGDDGETDSLYWHGSFKNPETAETPYIFTSDAINDSSTSGLNITLSSESSKEFTYDNDQITFDMTMLGVTKTIHLKKESDLEATDPYLKVGDANDYVEVSEVTVVPYQGYDSTEYAVYYKFTNTSDQNIEINSADVAYFDSNNVQLGTTNTYFAPSLLKPGETGYGGTNYVNNDKTFPTEGVTATVSLSTAFSDGYTIFDVVDAEVVELDYTQSTIDTYQGISVTVENVSGDEEETPDVTCGLLDSEGNLIGVAYSLINNESLGPNMKGIIQANQVIFKEGMTFDNVVKLDARVKLQSFF